MAQAKGERNYHIFYNLLAGATEQERQEFQLSQLGDYHLLNQSGCLKLENVDDAQTMQRVRQAMRMLFRPDQQYSLNRAIAAILHLGNIDFKASADALTITTAQCLCLPTFLHFYTFAALEVAAMLLGVDMHRLHDALTTRATVTKTEIIVTPMTRQQAIDTRDALAKAIYGRMFAWLVACINDATSGDANQCAFIGILDIFGFEDFERNSFEQFCINYANEKLQFFFNHHIFRMEQHEYVREGISWSHIEFADNQGTIDFISKAHRLMMANADDGRNRWA